MTIQKSRIGTVPIGWVVYWQRMLLRHLRHGEWSRCAEGWCGLTPRNVCAHRSIAVGRGKGARMVVAEITNWFTGKDTCLCPGECSPRSLRRTSRGYGAERYAVHTDHQFSCKTACLDSDMSSRCMRPIDCSPSFSNNSASEGKTTAV